MISTEAVAYVFGGPIAPDVSGIVRFKPYRDGTMVEVKINGLPGYKKGEDGESPIGPFGFHIHNSGSCAIGDSSNPFLGAGSHYNPDKQPHGNHAGDLPVLFSNHGTAIMNFFTDKFQVNDVIGKAVVIHQNPDDYRTEPAGNSGKRIACGLITKVVESGRSYK